MSGLGGLNKSENGVVIGLVQLQLPVVATPDDLARQTARIVEMVGKARRNLGTMDLGGVPRIRAARVVDHQPGDHVFALTDRKSRHSRPPARPTPSGGAFPSWEHNPGGNPTIPASSSTIRVS